MHLNVPGYTMEKHRFYSLLCTFCMVFHAHVELLAPSSADHHPFELLHHDFLSLIALLAFKPMKHIV